MYTGGYDPSVATEKPQSFIQQIGNRTDQICKMVEELNMKFNGLINRFDPEPKQANNENCLSNPMPSGLRNAMFQSIDRLEGAVNQAHRLFNKIDEII